MPQVTSRKPLIAVIGYNDVATNSVHYQHAHELGRLLIERGYRLLSGGMGGVMEAASQGARGAQNHSGGDVIAVLPGHNMDEANPYADIVLPSGLGFTRNVIIAHADAVIAVGGGAGTLSEMAYAWMFGRLIIALRVEGWSGQLADKPVDQRNRRPNIADDCVRGANTAQDAVDLVDQWLTAYGQASR
jgi:uncharacterized protein (TIGR00725 family)